MLDDAWAGYLSLELPVQIRHQRAGCRAPQSHPRHYGKVAALGNQFKKRTIHR